MKINLIICLFMGLVVNGARKGCPHNLYISTHFVLRGTETSPDFRSQITVKTITPLN